MSDRKDSWEDGYSTADYRNQSVARSEASVSPSAGDLLIRAIDKWAQHAPKCELETCAECDACFNQVRLAHKVWANSAHKSSICQSIAEQLIEARVIGHGEGQRDAIADVNAGRIDDLIKPRLDQLRAALSASPQPEIGSEVIARDDLQTLREELRKTQNAAESLRVAYEDAIYRLERLTDEREEP